MKKWTYTIRFEMDDLRFKNSREFYNYLMDTFCRDKVVLRMVDIEDTSE